MGNHAHGSPCAPGPPPPPSMSGSMRPANASPRPARPLGFTHAYPAFRGSRAVIKNDDLPPGRNRSDKSALAGKNGPRWLSRFEPGKRPAHGCTSLVGDKEDTSEACSMPQQGRHTNARIVSPGHDGESLWIHGRNARAHRQDSILSPWRPSNTAWSVNSNLSGVRVT
jgi:hypothetical protein